MKKIKFSPQNLLIFLLVSSIFALVLAYISQYVFGLKPCILCFYQRKPFFAVIIIAALFLFSKKLKKHQKLGAQISIILILLNACIAFYHAGVENKIFEGPHTCSSVTDEPNDLEALTKMISEAPAVRCDKPAFILFGLSMAGWNVVYCLFLVVISLFVLGRGFNRNRN